MANEERLQREALPLQIERIIRDRIFLGEYQQGQPISDPSLAREIGTSQIPVREAFRMLEERGILIYAHNKGFRVAILTEGDVRNIVQVRIALETMALQLAQANATDEQKENLRTLLGVLVRSAENSDALTYSRDHFVFHSYLFGLSGNDELEVMSSQALTKHLIFSHWPLLNHDPRIKSANSHKALLDYLNGESTLEAAQLIRYHISNDTGYIGYLKS